jgi:L-alanine-DL-glutamate epimerase-like enolase superfamily enzyme
MSAIERVEIMQPTCRPRSSGPTRSSRWVEYWSIPQLDDVTMSRMIMRDGYAVPPTAPGLGIDWDFAADDRLAVARAAIGPA